MTRTRTFVLLCAVCTLAAPAALALERIEPQHAVLADEMASDVAGDELLEREAGAILSQTPAAAADLVSPLEVDSASTNPGEHMHYKNGRPAKNGDKVIHISATGVATGGILYDAVPGNDYCNGRLAITRASDPCPNLKECLHADDVATAAIPDSTTVPTEG